MLESAALVTKRRQGREQLVSGNVDTVRRAARLLDELEVVWRGRIGRLDAILAEGPIGATGATEAGGATGPTGEERA